MEKLKKGNTTELKDAIETYCRYELVKMGCSSIMITLCVIVFIIILTALIK